MGQRKKKGNIEGNLYYHEPPPSSPLLPNLPPKPPRSRRKNFPIFFKFRFSFPDEEEPLPSTPWLPPPVWPGTPPGGDKVPDNDGGTGPPLPPPIGLLGVPKRSTPSLAAEMMAEPSMEGSKREEPPAEVTELDEEVVEA